jgi:transcriptional regulator with XRE-family HTH domain
MRTLLDAGRVARRITSAGLDQGRFAERAGVAPATVARVLRGDPITTPSAVKICRALDGLEVVDALDAYLPAAQPAGLP